MINLSDGELLDLLPSSLKNDTDMICLSYAIKVAVGKLLDYEITTMTQNFIDYVPESVLDVLAVELRSLYYLDSMDIETKRAIIKNTLIWHKKAGTPSAVAEMISVIFGEGTCIEWFNFTDGDGDDGEGDPGTFDIITSAQLTEDIAEYLTAIIERVKNIRSHLRWVQISRDISMDEYVALAGTSSPRIPVTNSPQITSGRDTTMSQYAGTAVTSTPRVPITNSPEIDDSGIDGTQYAAIGGFCSPKIIIGNTTESEGSISESRYIAVAAVSSPKIAI